MRVLIVEDNARMRGLIRSCFRDVCTDADWFECADGTEASAAFARCRPDWVLMDIAMPRMDGLAATRELKARFPAARIVILTQYDEALLRAAAQAAGACGYLLKENLSEVPGWIATHSAAGPSPECHPPGEAPVMQPTAPGKP